MSAHPSHAYVLFMAFPADDARGLTGWTQFRGYVDQAAGARPPAARSVSTTDRQAGIWRLLASNHRELARSAFLYGSFAAARSSVLQIRDDLDDVVVTTFRGPVSGSHGWYASVDDRVLFTCARWYETSSLSLEASAGAIAALHSADVAEQPKEPQRSRGSAARRDVVASTW